MDLHPNYSISAFEVSQTSFLCRLFLFSSPSFFSFSDDLPPGLSKSREKYENWKRVRLETTKNLMKTIVISGALNMSEMYNSAHAVDTSIRLHILSLSSTDALLQHVQTRQQDETSGNSTSSNAVLSQIVIKLSYHSFCSEDLVVVDSEAALSSPLVTNKYVELFVLLLFQHHLQPFSRFTSCLQLISTTLLLSHDPFIHFFFFHLC